MHVPRARSADTGRAVPHPRAARRVLAGLFFRLLIPLVMAGGMVSAARAHQSAATAIYLDYELRDTEIIAVVEGAAQHFGALGELDLESATAVSGPALAEAGEAFLAFLAERCPVECDGTPVAPELDHFEIAPLDEEVLPGRFEKLALVLTVVRYPLPGGRHPEEIRIDWTALPVLPAGYVLEDFAATGHVSMDEVVMSFRIGDDPPDFFAFNPQTPTFRWRPGEPSTNLNLMPPDEGLDVIGLQFAHYVAPRVLAVPVASIVLAVAAAGVLLFARGRVPWRFRWRIAAVVALAGVLVRHEAVATLDLPEGRVADSLDDTEVRELFTALHRNIYTAFDYENEEEVYDVLSQSVDGPLLDRIFTEVYRSLVLEEADGAAASVQRVEVLASPITRAPDGRSLTVDAEWTVEGVVAHLNHVHLRINRYRADYRLEPVAGLWKITAVEQKEAERVLARESPADTAATGP